jgi:hypothetical protein
VNSVPYIEEVGRHTIERRRKSGHGTFISGT